MMAAFNTLPAEEEPLVEKATKTKTLWRRLACSAAVTSLVLGYPANMNFYYGYFEDTKGKGHPKDYRLYLNLRQWGPDGQLTDVWYNEKVFFPVMDDGSDYVW